MTDIGGAGQRGAEHSATIVWIDAREAFIARWQDHQASVERLESEVPDHRKSTGHVRHDPMIRHGGGGSSQTAGEPHRLEHLARFVEAVGERLADAEEVVLLGPGTVREHLEGHLRTLDKAHHRVRMVSSEAAPRLTERQLIARLRRLVHAEPPRRTIGAYRWSVPVARRPSGAPIRLPHRVTPKPPTERDEDELELS